MMILEALSRGNSFTEDIARATELPVAEVLRRLADLETEGLVRADHTHSFSRFYLADVEPTKEPFCTHCQVLQKNCKPGGQWSDLCPLNPHGNDHRWVIDA